MKHSKKLLAMLLALALCVGLLPTTAFAADTGKAIQLVNTSNPTGGISGYDSTYDYIYYGYWTAPDTYTTSGAIKWRVLDTKTNMANATEGDGLFVLSEELLGTGSNGGVLFNNYTDTGSHDWQGSIAQLWCGDFAGIDGNSVTDAFSAAELAAILETTKTDDSYSRFWYSYNILNGDKVFFLSAEEASNSEYGFSSNTVRIANYNNTAADWWLRSPDEGSTSSTGYVNSSGEVTYIDVSEGVNQSARPAFNLDLSSVLFTSAADNSGHNSGFSEPESYDGSEWKLTLADSNSFASASITDGSTSLMAGYNAETLTISHASLSSLSNNYTNVTAMLTDSDGDIVYYGSINNDTSATSSTVTIPVGLDAGTYTLSIYGEDWNDAKLTDYATGTPFTTTINVIDPIYTLTVTAPTFAAVTYGYTQPEAASITITSSGNSDATITGVTVSSANFTIVGSGSTVTAGGTIDTWTIQPAANLAAGTYNDTITVTYTGGATATDTVSFTVGKATPSVTAPSAVADLVYSGDAQELVSAGSTTGGTMYYSLSGNDEDWSTSVPTGTSAGEYIVYYKVDGGNNYNDVNKDSVSVTIASGQTRTYTLRAAVTDSGPYNPGDTVTADVYLTAQTDGEITAAQFAFAGDWYTVTGAAGLSADDNVAFGSATQTVSIAYHDPISVSAAETKIATVTLTVNADAAANDAAKIAFDLTKSYINASEYTPASDTAPTVAVCNLTLTLTPGANASFDTGNNSVTAYLRYGKAGVYSDESRKTAMTALPSATAASGYELKTGCWTLDDGTQVSEADILSSTVWTASAAATPTTLKQYTVTLAIPDSQYGTIAYDGTTLTQNTEITVNEETTYGDIISMLAFTTVTDTAYQVRAWKIGDADVVSADAVSADVTLTPQIAACEFKLTPANSDNYTIAVSSGASGDSAPYTATYGTDVTFKLTPATGYAIYSVSYSVGGSTPVTLTADDNGDFTIPGGKIVGDVSLDVTAKACHEITFKAGTGSSMTTGTYYAWDRIAGLYSTYSALGLSGAVTDTAAITDDLIPDTSNAADGSRYRLAADNSTEPLWSDGSSSYTTAAILGNVVFGKDTAFTAIAIPQYLVTFADGADGFDGYADGAVRTEWVDENGTVSAVPTVNAAAHYEFSGWDIGGSQYSSADLAAFAVSGVTTVTPVFAKINYSVAFIDGGVGAFRNITGVSGTEGAYTAQYDESDISFTFTPDGNYSVTAIRYQAAGMAEPETLTAVSDIYTIPKESVTGNISVTVETDAIRTYTFTVAADDADKGQISRIYTVVTKVDKEPDLTGISVGVMPGYEFVGWTLDGGTTVVSAADIESETVTAATENRTYTAVFRLADLSVTYDSSLISVSGLVNGCAHLGTNLVLTPTDGLAVLSVTYTIGGGDAQTAATNTDGTYTISSAALTGDVVITVNVVKDSEGNAVRFAFVTRDEYFGENVWDAEARKIALLATGEMNGVYSLSDGTEFYYSPRYGAYVKWVDADETAVTLSAQLSYDASGTPTAITYDGDINGTGVVTAGDAGIINDILKNRYTGTLSDYQLFMLDTDDTAETDNSYQKVFTSDVVWVLKESVK